MYADHTTLQIVGQILIAVLFLGTALINSTTKVKQHAERMAALGVPAPYVMLWLGFAIQYTGGILVLLDVRTDIGVYLLLLFTVAATAIFHRFWRVGDPLMRHMHVSFLFSNIAVVGALLLLL
ncbi:MAG: DoxX family protein [Alphaproteobacteria bacterium]|nr:DoxX family protein [Alphaproteobacteria bacterium]MCZ6844264.1 DoxX family protein [Alphaproteobacteria bacterium]